MDISVSGERLAEALRRLRARGFTPTGSRRGVRSFEGGLPCKGGSIKIRFDIWDWDFLVYPAITILDWPADFPSLVPHLDDKGRLCYFAHGSIVLDQYDPAESIAQCLDQAQFVLECIRWDPEYRHGDIQDEFLVHWFRGQSATLWPVLLGTVDPAKKSSNYWSIKTDSASYSVISETAEEVKALATALGAEAPTQSKCPCWLLRSEVIPAVPVAMPASVNELFAWLREWDKDLYQRVQLILEREPSYLAYSFTTFAVQTPLGWLGFGFDLDPVHRLGARKNPRLYKQFLHKIGGKRGIIRLSITEFGPDFVHSRNLMFPDLKNKRIAVIGCGAIGSHVAPGLIRLGAGTGSGRLNLIDTDYMWTENLGRHVLGYPALFKRKAEALASELTRQFPQSKINACVDNVRDVHDLFDADLVIDATGEESVSEMVNARRVRSGLDTPVLHVRIRGNGECVQTFWAQGESYACFRCLLHAGHKNYREERFPVLKGETQRKQIGCGGFTPYAVSAPMSAAALCMEVIVDWLQRGQTSPRFRTRAMANANVFAVKDQDVARLPACPACGAEHAEPATVRQ